MKTKEKPVNDLGSRDLTQLSREELYHEIISNQQLAVAVLSKVDWIIGAFMSTLETEFHFGKRRMRKLLKGVGIRFRLYSDWPYGGLNFMRYLESFGYRLYFKGHHFMLRDLKDKNYYDDLASDLEEIAHKIRYGNELTEDEKKVLGIVRGVEVEGEQ